MTVGSSGEFAGPFLKIRRARQHIAELAKVEASFLKSRPFEVFESDDETGKQRFFLHLIRQPPAEIAAIIHDVLAGLRSSLDNAVCSAARCAGATDLRHTYFHVASDESEWLKSVAGRTRAAPAAVVDYMKASRPWQGGNDLLYALSKLANADKHQAATSFANRHTRVAVEVKMVVPPGHVTIFVPVWEQDADATLLAETTAGRIEMRIAEFDASLGFDRAEFLQGEPLVATLDAMANLCENLVTGLEVVATPTASPSGGGPAA